jgi:hypothetical protein
MSYSPLSHDEFVARLLVDIWTLATGRTLRGDVPPHELTAEELIDFWSDDHLDAAENSAAGDRRLSPSRPPGRGGKAAA